jgi:hypothetical protein
MKTKLTILIILLIPHLVNAQFTEKTQVGIYGNIGLPVGEFRQNVNNELGGTTWGLGMNGLINPKRDGSFAPVLIGLEGNYLHLGTEKTPESSSLPQLKTTYNYFTIGPLVRGLLSQKEEGIIPFVDGFVGLKVLNSRTTIDNSFVDTLLDQEYEGQLLSTNYEGLGYGIGVGFFNRKYDGDGTKQSGSFYLKINYGYGDRISNVKKGSIQVDSDGVITYQNGKTQTGMVTLQLGYMIF